MNDDRTLTALDQRGRAAAGGVRTAVAERPVPTFDPDLVRIDVDARTVRAGGGRSRPVVAVLAAAAAVLVVVAAVVALMGTGDPDSAPADRVGVGEPRRYVLGEVPAGFALSSVLDTDEPLAFDPTGLAPVGPVAVYGPDARTPRIGVYVFPPDQGQPGSGELPSIVDGQPEVEVSGRSAWEADDGFARDGIVVAVGDTFVVVTGAAAERSELVAVAAVVEVDGDRATVPEDRAPDGLSYLGRAHYLDLAAGVVGLRALEAGERTWTAAYLTQVEPELQEAIVVSAALGDPIRVRASMLATTDVRDVTVRGHDALLARATFPGAGPAALTVVWEERPGEIVQVSGLDTMTEDDILGLAEGLRVVEAGEVRGLRRQAMEAAATLPGISVVGRGTFTGGDDWVLLYHADTDTASLETTAPQGASSSTFGASGTALDAEGETVPSDEPLSAGVTYVTDPDVAWAYGMLGAEVAEVEVRGEGGSTSATIVEGEDLRGWVAELPPSRGADVPLLEIRALAADGTVLQTEEISA